MNRLLSSHRLGDLLSHAYIWFCLILFVMPFAALALILQALAEVGDVLAGRKVAVAEPGAQAL